MAVRLHQHDFNKDIGISQELNMLILLRQYTLAMQGTYKQQSLSHLPVHSCHCYCVSLPCPCCCAQMCQTQRRAQWVWQRQAGGRKNRPCHTRLPQGCWQLVAGSHTGSALHFWCPVPTWGHACHVQAVHTSTEGPLIFIASGGWKHAGLAAQSTAGASCWSAMACALYSEARCSAGELLPAS